MRDVVSATAIRLKNPDSTLELNPSASFVRICQVTTIDVYLNITKSTRGIIYFIVIISELVVHFGISLRKGFQFCQFTCVSISTKPIGALSFVDDAAAKESVHLH